MKLRAQILLLNYNGKPLLEKYLPSFIEAAKKSRFDCRVGVIDNASSDGSLAFLKQRYPEVAIYALAKNKVLCAYNEVAAKLEEEILIFMNNDICADADFVDALVQPFENDPELFMVTPRCLSMKDGSYEGNRTRARLRFGLFWASAKYPGYENDADKPGNTFQGGFGAFDRKKFLELGGYDDLYLPGRLEDADICFQAQQRGWKCLYDPRSVVYHEGGTSFKKEFGASKTLVINFRNTFLFMWKNLNDRITFLQHFLWLPIRLTASLLCLKPELFLGFCAALPLRGEARKRREKLRSGGYLGRVSDRDVLHKS